MSGAGFDDLLQQAEDLTTRLDGGAELPRVHRSFQQILSAGQKLCSQTHTSQDNAQIKASLLLSSHGQEIPKISDRLKALGSAPVEAPDLPSVCDTDIDGFLRNEKENAILSVVEEQKEKTFRDAENRFRQAQLKEWELEKKQILTKLLGGDGSMNFNQSIMEQMNTSQTLLQNQSISLMNVTGSNPSSLMSSWELAYAKQMHAFNNNLISGNESDDSVRLFESTAALMKETNIINIWKMVRCMTDASVCNDGSSIFQRRTSPAFLSNLVTQARQFLENNYLQYMKSVICNRPHLAQLGGEPGTLNIVKSFLKVQPRNNMLGYDDGDIDGAPLWTVIFYCLRCGDLKAVCEVAKVYESIIPEFCQWIHEYAKGRKLSSTYENKLKVYYRKNVHMSPDPYKVAVFSIIGRCDISEVHAEVAQKTEDYLWLKLSQVVVEDTQSGTDVLTLMKLQRLLSEEYGENHFNATANPLLYFQILFLTCQFEAAISFLSRFDALRSHACHAAIALHSHNLLLSSDTLHSKLLTSEAADDNSIAKVERLNFPQLIMLYTRKFELTDPREALNYFYTLKDVRSDGESLFFHCVSELVRESCEFEMLLGKLNPDGSRKPGAVDRYCVGDTKKLISKIAADTESKGLYEDAIQLYDLGGNADKVISLLNKLLSPVISGSDESLPDRLRLKNLAVNIAQRYRSQAMKASQHLRSTFHLLLDLLTFFDLYHNSKVEQALDVLRELQIIPTSTEQVQTKVNAFKLYSDEVRQNISDILLATMSLLTKQCEQQSRINKSVLNKSGNIVCSNARRYARALITFAGMLPYHLPGDTTARLVQLEVQMN